MGGIISTTRLRLAAGSCVLSAGLVISSAGGAIAWADTDATGSTASSAQSQGAEAPSSDPGAASAPAERVAHPLRDTLQATVQSALRTLRNWQQQQQHKSTDLKRSETEPAAANTKGDEEGSGPTTVVPSPAVSESNAPASDSTEVATDSAPPATDPLAQPVTHPLAPPVTHPLASPATDPLSPPPTDPHSPPATLVGPVPPPATVVGPVNPPQTYLVGIANAVAAVANVALSVPGVVASLPTSPTPVADVITLVQEMLTSVTNVVVQLLQVPSDLASLLLGMTPVTATATVRGGVGAAASALLLATPASQRLAVPPTFLFGGAPLPEKVAPLATVGDIARTGLPHELPVSGIASPAQDVVEKTGLGSFLEHTVSAILVPASLSALAAVALPGVGGLLIICVVGMRFGYRQAKALLEVRRAGIACFAGPGPLGVVRSGSLIALRRRASRVVRPEAQPAASLLVS